MERSVGEHIRELEGRIKQLKQRHDGTELSLEKRNEIESEIRVAEVVLLHFRSAMTLEGELRGTQDRDGSGNL